MSIVEHIIDLHNECKSKLATPANEFAFLAAVARLEKDRATLHEMLTDMAYWMSFYSDRPTIVDEDTLEWLRILSIEIRANLAKLEGR